MSIENILSLINKEIEQLKQVRALLATSGHLPSKSVSSVTATVSTGKKRGPKPGKKSKAKKTGSKRRTLSPEARKRIADAQHRRWAAHKAAAAKSKKK